MLVCATSYRLNEKLKLSKFISTLMGSRDLSSSSMVTRSQNSGGAQTKEGELLFLANL